MTIICSLPSVNAISDIVKTFLKHFIHFFIHSPFKFSHSSESSWFNLIVISIIPIWLCFGLNHICCNRVYLSILLSSFLIFSPFLVICFCFFFLSCNVTQASLGNMIFLPLPLSISITSICWCPQPSEGIKTTAYMADDSLLGHQ